MSNTLAGFAADPRTVFRPRVVIFATGGTIAGRSDSHVDEGYQSGAFDISDLIGAVHGLDRLASLSGRQVAQIGSQDADDAMWLRLAQHVTDAVASGKVDGVVITHGTDTIEETAFFLHLVLKSATPVVLTGAMRPATALSADGPLNLYNAVATAADPATRGRGVVVVLNDDLHSARDVTKSSTTDVHAFVSPGAGLLGTATYGRIRYFRQATRPHTVDSEFSVEGVTALPRVDIIYAHAQMPADLLSASVSLGARGIVVAGMGNGNVSSAAAGALAEAAKSGVAVVRSTRAISGEVSHNIELNDDALGFVAAGNLNPQKSRVLLQLCLAKAMTRASIRDAFLRY